MHAKQTMKKFDPIKIVLPLKFMSLGCTMVTLGSETLFFMSTPQPGCDLENLVGGRGEKENDGISCGNRLFVGADTRTMWDKDRR